MAVFRDNNLTHKIGIFDEELLNGFPSTVKWIAHNGAGYDQINVQACKAQGQSYLDLHVTLSNVDT